MQNLFENDYYFKDLDFNSERLNKSDEINIKKQYSRILKKAREDAKLDNCYFCGKKCTSFCNSHSVPRFCLENIAVNGEVNYSNKLIKIPTEKEEKGLNETGTFRLICRECDSKIFKDYENSDNYKEILSMRILAEIALKNYLKSISKRNVEIELYNQIAQIADNSLKMQELCEKQLKNQMDLMEYVENYNRAKKVLIKSWNDEYFIILFKELNYVVPVAFQSNIALICDLENNIINDIYNESMKYKIEDIQICIFPLKQKSIVLVFMDSKNKGYRKFYKQFKKLNEKEQLDIINYIVFAYSEDIFFSKNIGNEITENENLIKLSKKTSDLLLFNEDMKENALRKQFSFDEKDKIPNILLPEYKIIVKGEN